MLRITETENGKIKGLPGSDPRITVFKGVPFAAPPVGERRWMAPQKAENWEGIREAYTFGPISVQDTPGLGTDIYCREWHVDPEIPMSEDCLYLNIWTPAKKKDEKLPVLIWYFGGAFQWGYTAEMEFDGERLASRGIIVVSVNYRLAALGYLCHPEITASSPDAPANFGLLDQQAGLKWVVRNIANFGGDPEKISIAGQSAGGASVMNQLANEDNFKDIKGAAIISGIIRDLKNSDDLFNPPSLSEAEEMGKEFFDFLGVSTLAEAKKLDSIFIRDKYAEYARNHRRFVPIVDGKFSVGDPVERVVNGQCAPCPLIAGFTANEFIEKGENMVEHSVRSAFCDALGKDSERELYFYRFGPDIPGWDNPGCFHSVDLWFWFETLGKCWRPFVGRHYDLARKMCTYLADFVKTGEPNGKDADGTDLPKWEKYTADKEEGMNFTGEGPEAFAG